MRALILLLITVMITTGCNKVFYYNKTISTGKGEKLNKLPDTLKINIDVNCKYYSRRLYEKTNTGGLKTIDRQGENLIEIEHLYISPQAGTVVYITTIPSKYKNNLSNYLVDSLPNAFFFNTFRFGKIISDNESELTVSFLTKNRKHKDVWFFKKESSENLNLIAIRNYRIKNNEPLFNDVLLVDESGQKKIEFKKENTENFSIAFKNPKKEEEFYPNSELYFKQKKPGSDKFFVYIIFDQQVNNDSNILTFKNAKVQSDPTFIKQK